MPSLEYAPPPLPEGQEAPPPKEPALLFDGVVKKRKAHGLMNTMQNRHLSIYEDRLEYSSTEKGTSQVFPRDQVLSWAEKSTDGLFDICISLDPEKPDTKTYSFSLSKDEKASVLDALRCMANPGRADRMKLQTHLKSIGETEETTNDLQNGASFIVS